MSQVTPEEADLLNHENRFLKQTILTLRDELTKKNFESEGLIQTKASEFQKEISFFKSSIEKQRSDLESCLVEHDQEKQALTKLHPEWRLK